MMEHFRKVVFHTLLLWIYLSFVSCEENSEQYEHLPELNGKVCPSADVSFMVTAASKIACAIMCKNDAICKSMVYSPVDMTCTGCTQLRYVSSSLEDRPGAVFYKSDIVDCGPPTFFDPHLVLGAHNGDYTAGASIVYTCQPCTYFPSSTPAVMTCQADGVWSQSCVFGSDVGYLQSGVSIPSDAKGCLSEFGTTCSDASEVFNGFTMQGTTLECLCDEACCGYEDCCFDADCFTP